MSNNIVARKKQRLLIHIEREIDTALRNDALCTVDDVKRVAKTIMCRIELELGDDKE